MEFYVTFQEIYVHCTPEIVEYGDIKVPGVHKDRKDTKAELNKVMLLLQKFVKFSHIFKTPNMVQNLVSKHPR